MGEPLVTKVRNRTERLRQHAWRMRPYRSAERHIVVGGAPRSGTTLLRRLFDRHPGIRSGAETKLFVPAGFNLAWLSRSYAIPLDELVRMRETSPTQGVFIDRFAARVLADSGKARWLEKTPMNIRHLDWILGRFPEACVIHLVRDGRDVVCSMREHPDWRWVDGDWQKVLVPRPVEWYAGRWVQDTAAGMRWRGDPRYLEVRYEDLVRDPARELARICEAVREPLDPDWLAAVMAPTVAAAAPGVVTSSASAGDALRPDDKGPISEASIGRWHRDLAADDLATVMRVAAGRLVELGYPA